jgi:protein-L-isoaspartate(D-aspartate) O-methyltransferase
MWAVQSLDILNVKVRQGDGTRGWSAQAPFEAILVAAAPLAVSRELLEQLAPGRLADGSGRSGR